MILLSHIELIKNCNVLWEKLKLCSNINICHINRIFIIVNSKFNSIKVLHLSNPNDSMFCIFKTAFKSMWKNVNTISLFSFTRVFVLENFVLAKWKRDSLSCYDLHSISSKEITCWNIIFLEICFGYKREIVGRNKSLPSNNASNTHKKFRIFTSTY